VSHACQSPVKHMSNTCQTSCFALTASNQIIARVRLSFAPIAFLAHLCITPHPTPPTHPIHTHTHTHTRARARVCFAPPQVRVQPSVHGRERINSGAVRTFAWSSRCARDRHARAQQGSRARVPRIEPRDRVSWHNVLATPRRLSQHNASVRARALA
jgi:hypothetical protein